MVLTWKEQNALKCTVIISLIPQESIELIKEIEDKYSLLSYIKE